MSFPSLFLGFILSILLLFSNFTIPDVYASEDITNSWDEVTNLPANIASHASFSYNGRLYVVGGANVIDFSNVWFSTDNNGSLSNWQPASLNLPQTHYWMASVSEGNKVYIVGGASLQSPTIYIDSVLMGNLDSTGNIISWQELNPLPKKLGIGAAAIIGDRIYFAGGFNSDEVSDKVYSAPINADGTLGGWIESGVMPEAKFGLGMVSYNNNLIIVGGYDAYLNKVYKTTPDSNGIISSWQEQPSLPEGKYRAGVVVAGKTLLAVGGFNGTNYSDKVYFSELENDGTVGEWELSANRIPQTFSAGAAAIVNNYLYISGGFTDYYRSSVFSTKLNLNPDTVLDVPLLKQTDILWSSDIYNSADKWAPVGKRSMVNWGCAVTSAAMVFNYHKLTKMPDGSPLTPGSMNAWLKSQKDGYIPNGNTNWWALSRLSKLSKSQNPEFLYNVLQFSRRNFQDKNFVKTELENNRPVILEEPGHFIVAKGFNNDTFLINDPLFNRINLTSYSNSFISSRSYSPHNSDLSYIVAATNKDVEITMFDSNSNEVGESFIQEPMIDGVSGTETNGPALNIFDYSEPNNGVYTLHITSNTNTLNTITFYIYDTNGEVNTFDINQVLAAGIPQDLSIQFDKSNSQNSQVERVVTFESIIQDITELNKLGLIHDNNLDDKLIRIINQAKAAYESTNKNNVSLSMNFLRHFKQILDQKRGDKLDEEAYEILYDDVNSLISDLQN